MESNKCNNCEKTFTSKNYLDRHIKNKKCLNKNSSNTYYECEHCTKEFTSKYNLDRHNKSCKVLLTINNYKNDLLFFKQKNIELETIVNELKKENNNYLTNNITLKTLYEKLEQKYNETQKELKESYKNIQELLINNPKVINTTTTNNNYTTQNSTNNLTVKQYVSQLQPITAIDFQNTLQYYTDKYIDEGAIGYAKYLLDHPCNNKIVTTDLSRKIIAYRTDKNEFIKVPKCRELIKMAIVDHKNDIISICTKRRKVLGDMKTLDDDAYMNDVYTKKINDITEFIIFLKNDLEDYVETNVPNKISSEITTRTQQYNNVKTNIQELE
jgi:hypothetical protein